MQWPKFDAQAQRRLIVGGMFVILVGAGGWLVDSLLEAANSPSDDKYAQGVVMTALSGAIGSVLTLVGLIVKGLVDNLSNGKDKEIQPKGKGGNDAESS